MTTATTAEAKAAAVVTTTVASAVVLVVPLVVLVIVAFAPERLHLISSGPYRRVHIVVVVSIIVGVWEAHD